MSRIGRMPIELPKGVEVKIEGESLTVKGPKGSLTRTISSLVEIIKEDKRIIIKRKGESKKDKAAHGLFRALVFNMVQGVSQGFAKVLELSGVGYRASKAGTKLGIQIGFSHPVEIDPPKGISFDVEGQTKVKVSGVDKELVGLVAAGIRKIRGAEPYKGKGVRYLGERIRRKAGKAAKGAGAAA